MARNKNKKTRDRLDQQRRQNAGKLYFHQLELLTMLKPRRGAVLSFLVWITSGLMSLLI
jgi:hypothetical protein